MNSIVIIYGPTAVGKSSVAVELAKIINGEIISADSMQIYKNLNIGTAKITIDEMQGIKHHLINIKEPWEDYSVNDFCINAKKAIKDILSRNKTPIIVGGTGLYIKGLINGYSFGNIGKNEEFRQNLKACSNDEIYEKIMVIKPDELIDKNNRHRLIRKLERLTFGDSNINYNFGYNYKLFAICDDREKIYNRINARVDNMINGGLLDEVKYLKAVCKNNDCLAMKAIGYKELIPYINKEKSLLECIETLKQKSRNYAKRQFTFMNQFESLIKVDFCGVKETALNIKKLLEE